MKFAPLVAWLKRHTKIPAKLDYFNPDNGPAMAAIRDWSADIRVASFGQIQCKGGPLPFNIVDVAGPYPGQASVLIDTSIGDGAAELELRT